MVMRHWAAMTRTWPGDWDARKQGAGCWFCANQLGEPFYAGSVGDAHLERRAIARGHAIVVFRGRHVADFTALSPTEVAEYWRDIQSVAKMIERVFAPCHMNYQLLGNSVPHLHVHLVPRYLDDPAPEKPLSWDPKPVDPAEYGRQFRLLTEAAGTLQADIGVPGATPPTSD
jgi:diadenosine tetraphosphate (Ap4A) HIT family hydrolase